VLTYEEAADDPHMASRAALTTVDGLRHPAVAPRMGGGNPVPKNMPEDGAHTMEILEMLNIEGIDNLVANEIVRQA